MKIKILKKKGLKGIQEELKKTKKKKNKIT